MVDLHTWVTHTVTHTATHMATHMALSRFSGVLASEDRLSLPLGQRNGNRGRTVRLRQQTPRTETRFRLDSARDSTVVKGLNGARIPDIFSRGSSAKSGA
jgi:hypothetical protein